MIAAVICTVCFIACGGSQVAVTDEAPRHRMTGDEVHIDTLKSYPPKQVEDLQTFTLRTIPFFAPTYREHKQFIPTPLKPAGAAEAAKDKPLEQKPGFRVQVIAVNNQYRARRVESRVREILQDQRHHTYLVYDAPQYKVRVGDFTLRDEAVQLNSWLRQQGYYDSWVVRSKVFPARNQPLEEEPLPSEEDPIEGH